MINNSKPIVLYGGNAYGLTFLKQVNEYYGKVVAFADGSPYKRGSFLGGLNILTLTDCNRLYPDCYYYITAGFTSFESIYSELVKKGIDNQRILNAHGNLIRKRSCRWLENYAIITNDSCGCCCEQPSLTFTMPIINNIEYTNFQEFQKTIINKLCTHTEQGIVCENCPRIIEDDFFGQREVVTSVSFAAGGICNLNCYHCTQVDEMKKLLPDDVAACSQRNIDFLQIVKQMCSSQDLQVDIANGEITVNPLCDEILETARNTHTTVFTNAVKYSKKLEEMLETGYFNLFVDLSSGTSDIYSNIKGVNIFNKVIENITEYSRHGIVRLKYIFFKGINDNQEEIDAFISLVDQIGRIAEVSVSADMTFGNINRDLSIINLIVYFLKQFNSRHIPCALLEPAFTAKDSGLIKELFMKG